MTEAEKKEKARGYGWGTPLYDYVPRGKLTLKIDHGHYSQIRSTFTDGAKLKLEDLLHEVLVSLIAIAKANKARQAREQDRHQRLAAENERRAEVRKQQDLESAKLKKLEAETRDHTLAMNMRAYIAAFEAKRASEGEAVVDGEFSQWVVWARQQADRLDPLTPSPPSILDEKRPEELSYWNVRWEDD
jgi:hypothetical protein